MRFAATLSILVVLASPGLGATVAVEQGSDTIDLTPHLQVVLDPGAVLTTGDAASMTPAAVPEAELEPGRGLVAYWVHFDLQPSPGGARDWLLLPDSHWDIAELYRALPTGELELLDRSGRSLRLSERGLGRGLVLLRLSLSPEAASSFVARLVSDFDAYHPPPDLSLVLRERSSYLEEERIAHHAHGLYGGLMAAMVLYNLFLFLSVRDHRYGLYVAYCASHGLLWMANATLGFELAWPNWPRWDAISAFVLMVAACFWAMRFSQAFLETARHSLALHRLLNACQAGLGIATLVWLARFWSAADLILAWTALVMLIALMAAGVRALMAGFRPARYFLIAWVALAVGGLAFILAFLGVVEESFVTRYGPQIGSGVEVVLLAFGLADRINQLKREKEEAQLLHGQSLEREVAARTAELEDANRQLEAMSMADGLTGVANRRRFDELLELEWRRAGRNHQTLALALMDVDRFKAYNDRYGHVAGDECLRRVAAALSSACRRAGEVVARYGGEEFAVLIPGTTEQGAMHEAERLRAAVEALGIVRETTSSLQTIVTVSVGLAVTSPSERSSAYSLVSAADSALYEAKRGGRNRVVVAAVDGESADAGSADR